MSDNIDGDGYRANVGIILTNDKGRLFWARRVNQRSWQFPQGGIQPDETPTDAMYRELEEEVGLRAEHVKVIGSTRNWLHYRLPQRFIRRHQQPLCVGQKQIWFLLHLSEEGAEHVCFDTTDEPEFDGYRWVDYWEPVREVVFFKRAVYIRALQELGPLLFPNGVPSMPKLKGNGESLRRRGGRQVNKRHKQV